MARFVHIMEKKAVRMPTSGKKVKMALCIGNLQQAIAICLFQKDMAIC